MALLETLLPSGDMVAHMEVVEMWCSVGDVVAQCETVFKNDSLYFETKVYSIE